MAAADDDVTRFAELLARLKARTDRSYAALARRLDMNASTLHRYCAGEAVPLDFAVVERFAVLCRASPQERVELHRLWILAVAERMKKFAALLGVLGSSQNRATSGRARQTIFALSAALLGAAAIAVVGARASEPLDHPSGMKFGQSMEPPPLLLRPLAKSAAIALNESIAFSNGIRYPAAPFRFTGDPVARERAVECLTTAIYYEAASEGPEGQQAVAQVILNRVRSPSFPAGGRGFAARPLCRRDGWESREWCPRSNARRRPRP